MLRLKFFGFVPHHIAHFDFTPEHNYCGFIAQYVVTLEIIFGFTCLQGS